MVSSSYIRSVDQDDHWSTFTLNLFQMSDRFDQIVKLFKSSQFVLGAEAGFTKSRLSLVKNNKYGLSALPDSESDDFLTYQTWKEVFRVLIHWFDNYMVICFYNFVNQNRLSIEDVHKQIVRCVHTSTQEGGSGGGGKHVKVDEAWFVKTLEAAKARYMGKEHLLMQQLTQWVQLTLSDQDRIYIEVLISASNIHGTGRAFQFKEPLFRHERFLRSENRERHGDKKDPRLTIVDVNDWNLNQWRDYMNDICPDIESVFKFHALLEGEWSAVENDLDYKPQKEKVVPTNYLRLIKKYQVKDFEGLKNYKKEKNVSLHRRDNNEPLPPVERRKKTKNVENKGEFKMPAPKRQKAMKLGTYIDNTCSNFFRAPPPLPMNLTNTPLPRATHTFFSDTKMEESAPLALLNLNRTPCVSPPVMMNMDRTYVPRALLPPVPVFA